MRSPIMNRIPPDRSSFAARGQTLEILEPLRYQGDVLVAATLSPQIGEQDESLSVGRDVVVREQESADRHAVLTALESALEQDLRLAGPERASRGVDIGHCDARVGAPEDLLAAPRPSRVSAAGLRHLPLPVPFGERPDVDLVPARFVGGIDDPSTIGREGGIPVAELRGQDLFRLTRLEIEIPEVVLRVALRDRDVAAVAAPRLRPLGLSGCLG